ncbi:MAG: hypothetical protein ACE5J9_08730 [Methanosarcinales archaeon]
MMCPYCLAQNSIKYDKRNRNYFCSECKREVPAEYATNITIKKVVVSAVGFRGHGKTIYFASLFNILNELAGIWDSFHTLTTDEKSLYTVKDNLKSLKVGELPSSTPANFPSPTIVRFSNIPRFGDRFFLFYDTGGEAYYRASTLINFASFVKRARTVMFVIKKCMISFKLMFKA